MALVHAGARSVVGIDFSAVAAAAAQRRATEIGVACRYVVAEVPEVPLADASADLVYTGKGALIWMQDLATWGREVVRLLRPSGHLFIYEAHPAVPLWTWDTDQPRIRPDRSYFDRNVTPSTSPARAATAIFSEVSDLQELVERDPVGYPPPAAAQRMGPMTAGTLG